jgi:hypothetical protein
MIVTLLIIVVLKCRPYYQISRLKVVYNLTTFSLALALIDFKLNKGEPPVRQGIGNRLLPVKKNPLKGLFNKRFYCLKVASWLPYRSGLPDGRPAHCDRIRGYEDQFTIGLFCCQYHSLAFDTPHFSWCQVGYNNYLFVDQ